MYWRSFSFQQVVVGVLTLWEDWLASDCHGRKLIRSRCLCGVELWTSCPEGVSFSWEMVSLFCFCMITIGDITFSIEIFSYAWIDRKNVTWELMVLALVSYSPTFLHNVFSDGIVAYLYLQTMECPPMVQWILERISFSSPFISRSPLPGLEPMIFEVPVTLQKDFRKSQPPWNALCSGIREILSKRFLRVTSYTKEVNFFLIIIHDTCNMHGVRL